MEKIMTNFFDEEDEDPTPVPEWIEENKRRCENHLYENRHMFGQKPKQLGIIMSYATDQTHVTISVQFPTCYSIGNFARSLSFNMLPNKFKDKYLLLLKDHINLKHHYLNLIKEGFYQNEEGIKS
jgi:hypothetical protein